MATRETEVKEAFVPIAHLEYGEDVIEVDIGFFPGKIETFGLYPDLTVNGALVAAKLGVPSGYELRVNGDLVDPADYATTELTHGAQVFIVVQISGGAK